MRVEIQVVHNEGDVPPVRVKLYLQAIFFCPIRHRHIHMHNDLHVERHPVCLRIRIPIRKIQKFEESAHRQALLRLIVVVGGVSVADAWEPQVKLVCVELDGGVLTHLILREVEAPARIRVDPRKRKTIPKVLVRHDLQRVLLRLIIAPHR